MDHSDHSDHGDMSSMSDDMMGSMANSTETTTTADMSEPFCEGDGRVMLSGLQVSLSNRLAVGVCSRHTLHDT